MIIKWVVAKIRIPFIVLLLLRQIAFSQNTMLVEEKDPGAEILSKLELVGFFNQTFRNDNSSKLQVLLLQLGDKKRAMNYYLAIDSNGRKTKFVFTRDRVIHSIVLASNKFPVFLNNLDSSFGCRYIKFDSDEKEPNTVTTCLFIKEQKKFYKVLFANTSFEAAIIKENTFKWLDKVYTYLKSEFKIDIYQSLDY